MTILRWVWLQPLYAPEAAPNDTMRIRWRNAADLPPAARRMHSPDDLDARYAVKGDTRWVGDTAHSTEPCDEDLPHLITHVLTTPARTHDRHVVEPIHAARQAHHRLPTEQRFDAGSGDVDRMIAREPAFGVPIVGPVAADHRWQATADIGFDRARCTIDWDSHLVTGPQGQTSSTWQTTHTPQGEPDMHTRFATATGRTCPVHAPCVQSPGKARELSLRPQAACERLPHARQHQKTDVWKQQDATRAGIAGTIAPAVRRCDLRHARAIGLIRTRLPHILVAVALNLVRWYTWWADRERPHTARKPSKCAALSAAMM